jgi:glucans biosynthesis protein
VAGKKRCRMHSGAAGSGAPIGNQNALKQGGYTREAVAERKGIREMLREGKEVRLAWDESRRRFRLS